MSDIDYQVVPEQVWWLIDNYGDGVPAVGPFDSYEEAAAYDPYDERFVPRQILGATPDEL